MNFKTEQRYSKILKEEFPESQSVIESDKRIDFLCTNHMGHFFIIELKRPNSIITKKQLEQGIEYVSFLSSKLGNEYENKVFCIVVGGELSKRDVDKRIADSYRKSGDVLFQGYNDL